MVFSSIIFICYFLPLFVIAYVALGQRNAVIIAGSALFYCWGELKWFPLLIGSIGVNYAFGLAIARFTGRPRSLVLALGITANVGALAYFKYAEFVFGNLERATGIALPVVEMELPLGISFFTFQVMSYLIDVYRRHVPVERDIRAIATYIMMFPHLIAGPIVRYADIRDEIHHRDVTLSRFGLGMQYFMVGLAQKVLIANTMAPLADHVFSLPGEQLSFGVAWYGAVAYTIQIYFDFCGYSNMAIGLAMLMGFTFPRNFNYPYSARSMTDFWRRWHISLSSWFRDYVYIPLGGNRGGRLKTLRNLVIVFFLTGLWHGAAWTFIIWGLVHGAFLVAERSGLSRLLDRAPQLVARGYVFVVVVSTWVLFRAEGFDQAVTMFKAMYGFSHGQTLQSWHTWIDTEAIIAMGLGMIFSFPVIPWVFEQFKRRRVDLVSTIPHVPRDGGEVLRTYALPTPVLLALFVVSIASLATSSLNPFLYFRF